MPDKALAGYKVVSLGHHIAGPYCAKLLAGLGAEVIKVEKPGEGDPARRVGSFYQDDPHAEKSLLFLHLNTGKKSITLNLKTELGKKIFKELVSEADILVENFSPRVMPSLALDYRTLERINPRLVMASISNFGQTGPYRDYKASDLTLMAMGGLMWCHGEPDREPLTFPGWQAQYMGGCHGFYGSMAALYHAQMTGEGQQVDVSIMECTGAVSESYDIRAQITGELLGRTGNRMHGYAAWGLYPCKDGYVGLVYATAARWMQMAKMMEQPALADIEFFSQRRGRADEIDAYMLPWLMEHTKDEIYHIGQAVMRPRLPPCRFGARRIS